MSGVDRISNLPDEIILCIFCFFPSWKLRAQTSVLSKRWRQLWALLPSIQISVTAEGGAAEVASANYTKAILGCIKSFHADELRRLSLDLWIPTSDPDGIHASPSPPPNSSARSSSASLRSRSPHPRKPLQIRLLPLLSQHLHGTFPGVPLNCDGFCYPKSINLPKLTELTMHGCEDLIATSVKAPNLKSIKYNGDLQLLDLTGSPGLLEAALRQEAGFDLDTQNVLMRLLLSVSTIEVLTANNWLYQFSYVPQDLLTGDNSVPLEEQMLFASTRKSATRKIGSIH